MSPATRGIDQPSAAGPLSGMRTGHDDPHGDLAGLPLAGATSRHLMISQPTIGRHAASPAKARRSVSIRHLRQTGPFDRSLQRIRPVPMHATPGKTRPDSPMGTRKAYVSRGVPLRPTNSIPITGLHAAV